MSGAVPIVRMPGVVAGMALDPQPGWVTASVVAGLVMAMAFDLIFVSQQFNPLPLLPPLLLMTTTGLTSLKIPIWRLLPASDRQVAHAQWWRFLGGPLFLQIFAMAFSVGLVGLLHHLRQGPGMILAILGGQLSVSGLFAAFHLAVGRAHRQFGLASLVLTLPLFVSGMALIYLRPTPAIAPLLQLAGLVSLGFAGLVYGLGLPIHPGGLRSRPRSTAITPQGRDGPKGWASLILPLGRWVLVACCLSVGFQAFCRLLIGHLSAHADLGEIDLGAMVILMAPLSLALLFRVAARALATAPVGPTGLTLMIQGSVLICQLAVVGGIASEAALASGSMSFPGPDLVLELGIGACLVPLILRLSQPMMLAAIMIPTIMLPIFLMAFGGAPALLVPGEMALGLALLLTGWVWTWNELARGHRIWRAWPVAALWRGGGQ